jgi:iron complex transport system substrate-binding protein
MLGVSDKTEALASELERGLDDARKIACRLRRRPRVYFEEWDEPMISCIRWVSELIGVAGGDDCFPELSVQQGGKGRIIADPQEVVRRQPDLILGSWCGKKFRPEKVAARPGWQEIPAVRTGHVYEVKSSEILQPGPAALTDGLARIQARIINWSDER